MPASTRLGTSGSAFLGRDAGGARLASLVQRQCGGQRIEQHGHHDALAEFAGEAGSDWQLVALARRDEAPHAWADRWPGL